MVCLEFRGFMMVLGVPELRGLGGLGGVSTCVRGFGWRVSEGSAFAEDQLSTLSPKALNP